VPRRPNFVVILADDMGYSDPGCFGSEIQTPVLDRLAEQGTRFDTMYSTGRCGPSRNCLLTGMYAQQTAADVMTPGKIPNYTHFVPEYLRTQGYRSYHSGKWHFRLTPLAKGIGFDRSYTMLDEDRYFTQSRHDLDEVTLPPPGPGYYSTTAIANYGIDFLKDHDKNHKQDPFFLMLAFHSPHFPLQAPPQDIAAYRGKFDEGWDVMRERRHKRMLEMGLVNCPLAPMEPSIFPPWNLSVDALQHRIGPGEVGRAVRWDSLTPEQKSFHAKKMEVHAAMITRMDVETGKVMAQLRSMNAFEDTVVIFLSDNGASAEQIIRGDGEDPSAPVGSAKSFRMGHGRGYAVPPAQILGPRGRHLLSHDRSLAAWYQEGKYDTQGSMPLHRYSADLCGTRRSRSQSVDSSWPGSSRQEPGTCDSQRNSGSKRLSLLSPP
jgi:arylsulfatase